MTGCSRDPIGGKQIRFGEELLEVVPGKSEELLDFGVGVWHDECEFREGLDLRFEGNIFTVGVSQRRGPDWCEVAVASPGAAILFQVRFQGLIRSENHHSLFALYLPHS